MKSKKLLFFHYRLDEIDLKCGPRDLTRKVRLACCSVVELTSLKRFSTDHGKANPSETQTQESQRDNEKSKFSQITDAGKRTWTTRDNLLFCILLVEKVVQGVFKPIAESFKSTETKAIAD